MAFLNSLNTVGSALTAEQFRSSIILQNIANANTIGTNGEDPYARKQVFFEEREQTFSEALDNATGGGVRVTEVRESEEEFRAVYDPTNAQADEDGYVYYPNVNTTEETIDLMETSRAYEANISALSVVKAMAAKALEIGN